MMAAQQQQQQQQQAAAAAAHAAAAQAATQGGKSDKQKGVQVPADDEDEAGGEVSEEGLESNDIELVMSQANCSRRKAVRAIKKADGDIVTAISACCSCLVF